MKRRGALLSISLGLIAVAGEIAAHLWMKLREPKLDAIIDQLTLGHSGPGRCALGAVSAEPCPTKREFDDQS